MKEMLSKMKLGGGDDEEKEKRGQKRYSYTNEREEKDRGTVKERESRKKSERQGVCVCVGGGGGGNSSPWLPEDPLSLWPLQGEDHVTEGCHHPGDGELGVALCLQLHHLLQCSPEHRGMERGTLRGEWGNGGMRGRLDTV